MRLVLIICSNTSQNAYYGNTAVIYIATSDNEVHLVILTAIPNRNPLTCRCNSDKAHFNQIIKSKVRMNRMNQYSYGGPYPGHFGCGGVHRL